MTVNEFERHIGVGNKLKVVVVCLLLKVNIPPFFFFLFFFLAHREYPDRIRSAFQKP